MNTERFKQSLGVTALIATIWVISDLAFSTPTRKYIGHRDGWECQWEEGCGLGRDGGPARFADGFMVQAAHHDHDTSSEYYDHPDNGRILCLAHHALDEAAKGNVAAFNLLCALDPYTYYVRKNKKAYPWLNGYKKVGEIVAETT